MQGTPSAWSVASNGVDGLNKAEFFQPDLDVLDINMPDLGGFPVFRLARQSLCCARFCLVGRGAAGPRSGRSAHRLPTRHEVAIAGTHRIVGQRVIKGGQVVA